MLELDLLIGPDQLIRGVQLLNLNSGLGMCEVIVRDMPHQKLHIVSVLLEEVVPRKASVLPTVDLVNLAMEYELHELFLVKDRDFKHLELNGLAFVDALADVLEVDDGFVAVEVLVLVLDLEDQLVYGVLHGDDHSVILKDHPVYSPYHLVHSELGGYLRGDEFDVDGHVVRRRAFF